MDVPITDKLDSSVNGSASSTETVSPDAEATHAKSIEQHEERPVLPTDANNQANDKLQSASKAAQKLAFVQIESNQVEHGSVEVCRDKPVTEGNCVKC
jgi:hypothetical protein